MKNYKTSKIISAVLCIAMLLCSSLVSVFADSAATAEDFIISVARIEGGSGLGEKKDFLDSATETLEAYIAAGGSIEDEAIAEHYALYLGYKEEIDTVVENCELFMYYVDLSQDVNNTYPVTRNYLDLAGELLGKIDRTYYGVSTSLSVYHATCAELKEPEENCALFVESARLAAEATVYADAKKNTELAEILLQNLEIPDYPGIEEAKENIKKAKTFMGACELKAAPFIQAVDALKGASDIKAAIAEAYALLEGIDKTTNGVDIALTSLKSAERKYNKGAEDANAEMDALMPLIFSFIF